MTRGPGCLPRAAGERSEDQKEEEERIMTTTDFKVLGAVPEGFKVIGGTEFQVMPDLTDEKFDALRDDIADRGIQYKVIVDQHGRILDGYNRAKIAAELGIDVPVEIHTVEDDQDAR